MVFEQSEIESAILSHFATVFEGKRVPVLAEDDPVDQMELSLKELDQILSLETPSFKEDHFETMICNPFTFIELERTLSDLPNGKAAGADNLANELLKNSSYRSKFYLQSFLNKIIQDGEVPVELNRGKCMLVFKVQSENIINNQLDLNDSPFQGGDALQPSQYRPITIPSNILRLLTVRMCKQMTEAAEKNGLIGQEQFGFRKNRSTLDAVFLLSTLLRKAKAKTLPYKVAFLDISKVKK